jgi:hypothetical protein
MHLRLAAVHPTRPDVVFVWADIEEGFGSDQPDQLWATQDGGTNWTLVYAATGDLPGFAFSPDGTELLVAGPKEGVQMANVNAALAEGKSAFTQQFGRQVWGLHWTTAGLTAGTDNFTPAGVPAFTYGSSNDQGKSFSKLMSICDVRYDACDATSSLRMACDGVYDSPLGGFRQDFTQGPRCAGNPTAGTGGSSGGGGGGSGGSLPSLPDGGVASPSTGRNDLHIATGCEIGAGRPTRSGSGSFLVALGVLASRLRRRSRRAL